MHIAGLHSETIREVVTAIGRGRARLEGVTEQQAEAARLTSDPQHNLWPFVQHSDLGVRCTIYRCYQ